MAKNGSSKKFLWIGIVVAIIVVAAGGFFFYNGPSNGQSSSGNDFDCWPASCSIIPDANGKQACEDWKAGKTIRWPSDCTSVQSRCVELCEFEKSSGTQDSSSQTTDTSAQKQTFDTLPSLVKGDFASDVTTEDKNFAIEGISTMDFYLQKWFSKSTDKPSELQVSTTSSDPNGGAQIKTESGTAIILIETGNFGWQRQIQSNKDVGGEWRPRLVAHEYVHVYQFQNGCGRVDAENPAATKWFIEGEAEWLSYMATIDAGQLPKATIPQLILTPAMQVNGSLQSFEKSESVKLTASSPTYFLFNMAIDYLMKDRDIKTLDDFCANIGKGQDAKTAFQNAFGISMDKFYSDFENYRSTWSSMSSTSGQQPDCSTFESIPSCSYLTEAQGYSFCKQCFPNK